MEEQNNIKNAMIDMKDNGIQFVVPRGYQNLPVSVPGSDIDLVIKTDDFDTAVRILRKNGFSRAGSPLSRLNSLAKDAVQNPKRAKELLLTNRGRLYQLLKSAMFKEPQNDELAAQYNEFKAQKGDIFFHLMNHLAYKSPHNQQKIPVDPVVEKHLHERSEVRDTIPVPSPPDEVAHLVCRGVFDYEGEFPTYYEKRCDKLLQIIFTNDEMEHQLKELLSRLFFEADNVVMNCLQNRDYDLIKRELLRYTGY